MTARPRRARPRHLHGATIRRIVSAVVRRLPRQPLGRRISTPGRNRTPDIRCWNPALCQLSYRRICITNTSVRPEGFEPPASGSGIRRSAPAELRARTSIGISPSFKHLGGFEPPASGLAVRRSGQLSYRCIHRLLRSRGVPARGGEDARHRESRSPTPGAARPGGSPRGLRCSLTHTRVVKQDPARQRKGALPHPVHRGGRAPCCRRLRRAGLKKPYTGAPPMEFP